MTESEKARLDEAARAGWLYFIAGNTQEEIARKLKVSRPTAQRLVSLALSERLITFRLEHPITACMELAARLSEKFELRLCEVVPSDPASESSSLGIAEAAASFLEQHLRAAKPTIVALGTGRTLRAAVEQFPRIDCPQHKLIALVGNISMEGTASFYDVLVSLSNLTQAPHYPMPLPVVAPSRHERDQMLRMEPVRRLLQLAENADVDLVGIGRLDDNAPLHLDGFVTAAELAELGRLGAIGEITGWAYDAAGRLIEGGTNERLTSVPREAPARRLVIGVAQGVSKVLPLYGALKGRLINGLITNETTARSLLGIG